MRISRLTSAVSAVAFAIIASGAGFAAVRTAAADDRLPGDYIVVLADSEADPDAAAGALAREHGLSVAQTYRHALRGFAATVPAGRLRALERDPRVAFVSEDRPVSAWAKPTGGSVSPQPPQSLPSGIDRADGESALNTGAGVTVAVIDTGIDLRHPDLAANIVADKSCIVGKKNGNDDNGHGTHVAGSIAAIDNAIGVVGMAPGAKLAAVKVLNSQGSGSWSSIICGLDWVTANAASLGIKVANLSLGGGGTSDGDCGNTDNDALHKAICRTRDAGVTIVVAAGNNGASAASFVPAAYDDAVITVSALADSDGQAGGLGAATSYGADDTFASFSNYGAPVDIGAPGVAILSTWKGGGYATISGTSMASPHAAGAAALYLSANPGAAWNQVRDALVNGGEVLGTGHADPSGAHPEPVLDASAL